MLRAYALQITVYPRPIRSGLSFNVSARLQTITANWTVSRV